MKRTENGRFGYKLDEAKTLCSFRLTQYTIAYLDLLAKDYESTRTDIIESWTRGELDKDIILQALDEYINSQLTQSGGNQHKKKGETRDINNKRDYTHLLRFKKFVEDKK